MKRGILRSVFLAMLCAVALTASAWADTLELRDGRIIQGKFLGGSEFNIRFQVNGREQIFPTKDVLNISFNDTGSTDSSPAIGSNASAASTAASGSSTPVASSAAAPAVAAAPASGAPKTITIPAGTHLLVRMIDGVDSSKNKVGDRFHASLEDNLAVNNDVVVAPKGADVYGRLSEAKSAGSISGSSQLRLELTGIRINGQIQTITTSDYDVSGKSRGIQSAERIGGAAAVGAVIGAIAGGGKGAAIGAGVGAGAGTGVQVLTKGEQVRVPSETVLDFTLDQAITVTVPATASH
jgi:hypothetical protein